VLEHEVLPEHHRRIATLPCGLLRQINARIAIDEARHAAFGMLYLEHVVPNTSAADRAAALRWIADLWRRWCAAANGRDRQRGWELHPDRDQLECRAARIGQLLHKLGLAPDDRALG
jgi:hypothetical protein